MKIFLRNIRLVLLLGCMPIIGFSQDFKVDARIDTASIRIGEQTTIKVNLVFTENTQYQLPVYSEGIDSNIIFARSPSVDTLFREDKMIHVQVTYPITSFNAGVYFLKLGPFIKNQKDTVWSKTLKLSVASVNVDTSADIKPIKPLQIPVYSFKDYVPKILLVVGIIVLIALLIFLGFKYWKKIKFKPIVLKQEKQERADDKAVRLLEDLKRKKLCEQSEYKEFYTELTDILREYFEETLRIHTFERTSEELIQDIALTGKVSGAVIQNVREILTESDLVKFAKHSPLVHIGNMHYGYALFCIAESKYLIEKEEVI